MELGIETNIIFMYKIGIIDTIDDKGIKLLENNKNFSYEVITDLSSKNLLAKLPEFDGVTLRRGKLDEEILKNCKKLKVIARHGVGYDNVDTSFIKKKNISLLVTHNSTSTSPAEHAMFMIINIYKGREMFDSMVREGNFHKAIHLKINDNFELFNKNVLIAGFGRIGKKLIKKCLGFDMNVSVYDPYVDKEAIQSLGGKKVPDFYQALKEADILSLSLPLNKETKNFISLKEMSIMKKSAVLINISRGGIVNEKDLNRALEDKLISFEGIDVFEKEPPDLDNPLLKNNRVLLSPHAATFTRECLESMSMETVQNIIDFFENKIDPIKIIQL